MGRSLQRVFLFIACSGLSFCSLKHEVRAKTFPVAIEASNVSFGRDFYALQSTHWNVANTNAYPMVDMSAGNLDNTFGIELSHVDMVLNRLNPTYYRTHIINTTCVRNGNCGKYEIGYGYNKASFNAAVAAKNPKILRFVTNRTSLYKALFQKYPGTAPIVSPALEHDLSVQSWNILADTVLAAWPGVKLANSPDAGIPVSMYKNPWVERHGKNFPLDADIVSLDGFDATDIDIENFRKRVLTAPHVKIALGWTRGDNCRVKQWIDPRARTNCPSRETFELMSHIMEAVPNPVSFTGNQCKKIVPLNGKDIWKPLAESYPTPDPRQERPVLITDSFKSSDVNLLASNGQRVGTLGFYGTYGKQFRWYSGYGHGSHLSGYEFQKAAIATSGSPYVWIVQNGLCKGPFLPGRRGGIVR